MRIRMWTDTHANIHSAWRGDVELEEIGYSEEEWGDMTENEQDEAVKNFLWGTERLSYGWEAQK